MDWNLEKKLFSTVIDNAIVNDSMVRSFKGWLCGKSSISFYYGKLHWFDASNYVDKIRNVVFDLYNEYDGDSSQSEMDLGQGVVGSNNENGMASRMMNWVGLIHMLGFDLSISMP